MNTELRKTFHRNLMDIEKSVNVLFAMVAEGLAGATEALLAGDLQAARLLAQQDAEVDRLYADVETLVERELSLQSPAASDLRFLLTVLRIVPELERSADLAEHIASAAARGIGRDLNPRMRLLIEGMGEAGVRMWRAAADAFAQRDGEAGSRLREQDDELDDLHSAITSEVAANPISRPLVMEWALVARYYERLGDHAVNVAERVRRLAPPV